MQRGTGAGKGDWNKQNMRKKEGMHGFDKDRAGFSNCVVRSPVFSCTELTACSSMLTQRAAVFVYVCPLHGR